MTNKERFRERGNRREESMHMVEKEKSGEKIVRYDTIRYGACEREKKGAGARRV